ncbi:MAG: glycosyltransferase family 4 protein [Gemmatimonadaceae bacterium]
MTRWMVEAAAEWRRRGHETWFVVPRPRSAFPSGGSRPTLSELLDALPRQCQPARIEPPVGFEFELGTPSYRASVYASAALTHVPSGVPIIVSDDEAAWGAGDTLAQRNPFVGVLHADDHWYYDLAERHQRTLSAVISVSRRVAQRARDVVGSGVPVMETIPCGIAVPAELREREAPREKSARARLIWLGRIDERQKRVSDLGRIASALNDAGVSFELDIVGDGDDIPLIQAGLSAAVTPNVHFHGWVASSAVDRMLTAADVLLLPSNFEGMPLAAMEGLARGCAVVASSSSGLEEYAAWPETRDCLWIHEVGDVAAATTAVRDALAIGPVVRSAPARRFAEAEFSIGTCMDRYAGVVASLPAVSPHARLSWRPSFAKSLLSWSLATVRGSRRWLTTRIRPDAESRSSRAAARPVR